MLSGDTGSVLSGGSPAFWTPGQRTVRERERPGGVRGGVFWRERVEKLKNEIGDLTVY